MVADEAVDDRLALRLLLCLTGVAVMSSSSLAGASVSVPWELEGGTICLAVVGDDIVGMFGSTAEESFSCCFRFSLFGVLSLSANTILMLH